MDPLSSVKRAATTAACMSFFINSSPLIWFWLTEGATAGRRALGWNRSLCGNGSAQQREKGRDDRGVHELFHKQFSSNLVLVNGGCHSRPAGTWVESAPARKWIRSAA